MITEDRLRELASLRSESVVVSLYLDVDGRRFPKLADVEPYLDELARTAREKAAARGPAAEHCVAAALERISGRVREGFDRSRTRGLVFFAGDDVFEVVELPRPVRSRVMLNQAPALRQLEAIVDEYEPFVVVLVDRQRARLFRFELGELTDRSEVVDEVPRRVDVTDEEGLMASHVQAHVDELVRRHLKHVADVIQHEADRWASARILLGGPTESVAELEAMLHPSVRPRVAGRLSVAVAASEAEIRDAALVAEAEVEHRSKAEMVARLRELAGNGRAVVGVDPTLRAVYDRRVDVLVVSNGLELPGWRCQGCGFLSTRGSTCPVCEGSMEAVDDVIGEAVDAALLVGSRVLACEDADLDVLGGIGALLRF
ncbi:MAG: hypothetical protein HYU28_01720 [Actinobacteria bacterium]|nr:hypothetical protein [Actinomycetota bacterium]